MCRAANLELIDRVLADLARLREQIAASSSDQVRPGESSGPSLESEANSDAGQAVRTATERRQIAARLVAHWAAHRPSTIFRSGPLMIDLATPEGRSRLLVYAVLSAAKLRDGVAERTVLALEAEGLLAPERLRRADPADQGVALAVLQREYKALISKTAKVNAIYANQRLLDEIWGGDLSDIYLTFCGDDAALIQALQQFAQMKSRAYWLCRELKAHGVWTEVGPEATLFIDADVRRAIHNLGLVQPDATSYAATREACEKVVRSDFGGDVLPLYRHGRQLCADASYERCKSECPVMSACSVWTALGVAERENPESLSVDSAKSALL